MRHPALRRYFRHGMLPQLMVFESVARLGSFTRAGEELCLAQPTVSVQVRKLSETVGIALLKRSGRKVILTEAGAELYDSVLALFRFFIDADARLEALRALRLVQSPQRAARSLPGAGLPACA